MRDKTAGELCQILGVTNIRRSDDKSATYSPKCDQSEVRDTYDHPHGHRTSNMLDRVMRRMNRYLDQGLHLHGSKEASERHVRAWALVNNFRPWSPASKRANKGYACPAERLNRHRYQEDWLGNLLVSASMAGYRR